MNILSETISLIYYNYQVYLFLIPSFLLSLFLFSQFRKKAESSFGIVKVCSVAVLLFLLCGFSAHYYSNVLILKPIKYHVTLLEQEQEFESIVDSVEVSSVVYSPSSLLDKRSVDIDAREYVLNIPCGYNRKVYFYSSDDRGKVLISYSIGDTQYAKELDLSNREYMNDGYPLPDNSTLEIVLDFFIRFGLHLLTLLLCSLIVLYLSAHIHLTNRTKRFLFENRYGVLCFLMLLVHLIGNRQTTINPWAASSYGLHYGLGFGSRFMIGSILKLLSGSYLSHNEANIFLLFHLILLLGLLSYCINFLIKKSNYNKVVLFLCLLYLVSPGNITAMWKAGIYGKLETYNLLYTLLSVILFHRIKNVFLKYISITALSLFNMAIYQGFIFLYYPVVLVIMIADCFHNKTDKRRRSLTFINIVLLVASFFVFQFATSTIFSNLNEMTHYLNQNTSLEYKISPLNLEYFSPLSESYKLVKSYFINRRNIFLSIIFLFPSILPILTLWYYCIRKQTLKLSLPYLLPILTLLLFLPQFIFNIDWGRWSIAITFYTFFATLYLHYSGFPKMQEAFVRAETYLRKYPYIAVILLLYIASLSKFSSTNLLTEVPTLIAPLIQP